MQSETKTATKLKPIIKGNSQKGNKKQRTDTTKSQTHSNT